uniref:Prokineticin 1 n=1 Tax=Gopherus evgoodei TaxID=1825980 RepID=A0A8C4VHI5_9SAUR
CRSLKHLPAQLSLTYLPILLEQEFSLAHAKACERDLQCGAGTCCAISLWLRGLRMCTPLGQEGDECHPFSHKNGYGNQHPNERKRFSRSQRIKPQIQVPFLGKRQHHTCPCLPNFICSRFIDGRFRCSELKQKKNSR